MWEEIFHVFTKWQKLTSRLPLTSTSWGPMIYKINPRTFQILLNSKDGAHSMKFSSQILRNSNKYTYRVRNKIKKGHSQNEQMAKNGYGSMLFHRTFLRGTIAIRKGTIAIGYGCRWLFRAMHLSLACTVVYKAETFDNIMIDRAEYIVKYVLKYQIKGNWKKDNVPTSLKTFSVFRCKIWSLVGQPTQLLLVVRYEFWSSRTTVRSRKCIAKICYTSSTLLRRFVSFGSQIAMRYHLFPSLRIL